MVAEVEEGWESPSAVPETGGLTCPLQKKHPAQVFISLLTIISEL